MGDFHSVNGVDFLKFSHAKHLCICRSRHGGLIKSAWTELTRENTFLSCAYRFAEVCRVFLTLDYTFPFPSMKTEFFKWI